MNVEWFLKLQMTTLHPLESPFSTRETRMKIVGASEILVSHCRQACLRDNTSFHPQRNSKLETDTSFQLPKKCFSFHLRAPSKIGGKKEHANKIPTMGTALIKFRTSSVVKTSQGKPSFKFTVQNSFFSILTAANTSKNSPFLTSVTPPLVFNSHTPCLLNVGLSAWHHTNGPKQQGPALLSNLNQVTGFLVCKRKRHLLWSPSGLKFHMLRDHFPQKIFPQSL